MSSTHSNLAINLVSALVVLFLFGIILGLQFLRPPEVPVTTSTPSELQTSSPSLVGAEEPQRESTNVQGAEATESTLESPPIEAAVDVVMGTLANNDHCLLTAEIIGLILQESYPYSVRIEPFPSKEQMYAQLFTQVDEAQRVDFTPCFIDTDRDLLKAQNIDVVLLGRSQSAVNRNSIYVATDKRRLVQLNANAPCLLSTLALLDLTLQSADIDAVTWVAQNTEQIAAWTNCDSQ